MTRRQLEDLELETRAILAVHKCQNGAASCPMCMGLTDVLAGIRKQLPAAEHGSIEPPELNLSKRLSEAETGRLFE